MMAEVAPEWIRTIHGALPNEIWIAFLTLLLAVPGWMLALISHDTAKRQLRAYVSFGTERTTLDRDNKTGKWIINYDYKNNGVTPAYKFTIATGHFLADNEDAEASRLGAPYSVGALGPSDIVADWETTELTDADVEALRRGSKALIFYGVLKYTDAFKRQRWTRFRYFIGGSVPYAGPTGPDDFDMVVHSNSKGNEAN